MIKNILITLVCLSLTKFVDGQSIFSTIEVAWRGDTSIHPLPIQKKGAKYYSITLTQDPHGIGVLRYPFKSDVVPSFDTIIAIKELLSYKGDNRICGVPVMNYCFLCSTAYRGDKYYYSLQLQALYILHQLIYDAKLVDNPYPVLRDLRSGDDITVDEVGITRLFNAYIAWYEKIKHMTMAEIRKFDGNPYIEAEVSWVR